MRSVQQLLLALACGLCLPAAAGAQEQPQLDPDSPAGVEYQLPLDQARDDAAGSGKGKAGASSEAPLFGSGIGKDGSTAAGGEDGQPSSSSAKGGSAGSRERESTSERTGVAIPGASESSSGGPSVSLIAAAVLLAGGALGLGLRRAMGRTGRA